MAAYRCTTCAINYPNYRSACSVCGGKTDYITNVEPHTDWQDRVESLNNGEYNSITPLPIPHADANVVTHDGRLWIPHEELLKAGYACLDNFDVVWAEGKFYELQGHVGKHSRNMPGGAWWVEEIDPEVSPVPELLTLTDEEYSELNSNRFGAG